MVGNSTTVVLVATFRQTNFETLPTVFEHDDRRVRRPRSINDGPRSLTGIKAKTGGALDSALCDGTAFAIGAS
jgi:hypothetical protein